MIENITIAIFLSGVIAFLAYVAITAIKGSANSIPHFVCIGLLFLLSVFQFYRFLDVYDAKSELEEEGAFATEYMNDVVDFVDEVDRECGKNGQRAINAKQLLNRPVVEKGLKLLGIQMGPNATPSLQMVKVFKERYTKFLWKRVGWIAFFFVVFVGVGCALPGGTKRKYSSYDNDIDTTSWAD